jgi:hypothetical protein
MSEQGGRSRKGALPVVVSGISISERLDIYRVEVELMIPIRALRDVKGNMSGASFEGVASAVASAVGEVISGTPADVTISNRVIEGVRVRRNIKLD